MKFVRKVSMMAGISSLLVGITNASPLTAGSDAPQCQSMLHPGAMSRCEAKSESKSLMQEASKLSTDARMPIPKRSKKSNEVTEEDIDNFLANYGKPPRAAVRALLNPSDQNIAAMAAEENRRQVVAAYVAQRWTELQQGGTRSRSDSTTVDAYRTLPLMLGLRLQLIVTPGCTKCDAAALNLRRLLDDSPVLDASIVVVSGDEGATLETLLNVGASIPVHSISELDARSMGWETFPMVEIVDVKTKSKKTLIRDLSVDNMKKTLISMRKTVVITNEAKQ